MEQKEFQKKLGAQIARLRKNKKISKVNFAYMLDKEKQNFNKIEKGHENPKTWFLYKIALVPDVPFSKFFEWE